MGLHKPRTSIVEAYQSILGKLAGNIDLPAVQEVLLPPPVDDPLQKDEFGFLLLEDGSAGPFYTCLGDTRRRLEQLLLRQPLTGTDPLLTAMGLGAADLHRNALALGALNAISQHLLRRAGLDPAQSRGDSIGPGPADRVGMVGFFGPLVRRYLEQGLDLVVIEQRPERVPVELGLEVHRSPSGLAGCNYVICTASTLINNTLEQILSCVGASAVVNLMGPSASLLPDPLFLRGVDIVGGIVIDDLACLRGALAEADPGGRRGANTS